MPPGGCPPGVPLTEVETMRYHGTTGTGVKAQGSAITVKSRKDTNEIPFAQIKMHLLK